MTLLANESQTISAIIHAVCRRYEITPEEILGRGREYRISHPRMLAMYITRSETDMSYPRIGRHYNRHHTAVINACNSIKRAITKTPNLESTIAEILASKPSKA